jgi:hypothetical protein
VRRLASEFTRRGEDQNKRAESRGSSECFDLFAQLLSRFAGPFFQATEQLIFLAFDEREIVRR